jgi:3-keto-disaccharide hydrolase
MNFTRCQPRRLPSLVVFLTILGLMPLRPAALNAQQWSVHDMDRPTPPVVDPGSAGGPPSDAIVLFGADLSQWRMKDGAPAKWKIEKGYIEIVPGSGDLVTARAFGNCQLHLEWASPAGPKGEGQERGNSGVYLMGRYEVQVLDSYHNRTYADGQAAAIYGQFPPLVNASRPPGDWQAYDIVFHRPRFGQDGKLVAPARMTVFHNGVLVQDDVELLGATVHAQRATYAAHPDRLPLMLQDHGHPVRYRNIWLRELPER